VVATSSRPEVFGRRAVSTARVCLNCGRHFRSASIANRLCQPCAVRARGLDARIAEVDVRSNGGLDG
jgi:hypothetical protein